MADILLLRVLALYMRGERNYVIDYSHFSFQPDKTITIVLTVLYILQAAAGLAIVIHGDIFEERKFYRSNYCIADCLRDLSYGS